MTTTINLEVTNFDFSAVVQLIENRTMAFHKGKVVELPDFGIVLVDGIPTDKTIREMCDLDSAQPIFLAPNTWLMAHIVTKLGAFSSVGQARKNGWNFLPEWGLTSHIVRINKIRGILHVWKEAP